MFIFLTSYFLVNTTLYAAAHEAEDRIIKYPRWIPFKSEPEFSYNLFVPVHALLRRPWNIQKFSKYNLPEINRDVRGGTRGFGGEF